MKIILTSQFGRHSGRHSAKTSLRNQAHGRRLALLVAVLALSLGIGVWRAIGATEGWTNVVRRNVATTSSTRPMATIVVNDGGGGKGGTGCKLRDALDAAMTDSPRGGCPAGSGDDVIMINPEAITLAARDNNDHGANGLPAITSGVTIIGTGTTIRRDPNAEPFRIFYVAPTGRLELRGVYLENGFARGGAGGKGPSDDGGGGGGGAGLGGAIYNRGTLTVFNSAFGSNTAEGGAGGDGGRGIPGTNDNLAGGGGGGGGLSGNGGNARQDANDHDGGAGGGGCGASGGGVSGDGGGEGGGFNANGNNSSGFAGGAGGSAEGGDGGRGDGTNATARNGAPGGICGGGGGGGGKEGNGGNGGEGAGGGGGGEDAPTQSDGDGNGGNGGFGGGGGGGGEAGRGGNAGFGAGGGGAGSGNTNHNGGGGLSGGAGGNADGGFDGGAGGGGGAGLGGAIFNQDGTVTLTNVTLSGNATRGGAGGAGNGPGNQNGGAGQALGGGIYSYNGSLTVNNATFSNNSGLLGGGIFVYRGSTSASITLRNTIVANSSGNDCFVDANGGPLSQSGAHNLIESNGGGTNACPGVLLTADPSLEIFIETSLIGDLPIHRLKPGSPAIDQGLTAGGVTTDQSGRRRRPVDFVAINNSAGGDGADIGAYEVQDGAPPTINCPANITASTAPGACDAAVSYNVTAADDTLPAPTVECSPPSGRTFPLGTTTVNCTARDSAGKTTNCSFNITVNTPPPSLTTQPINQTVGVGATATFSVVATGGNLSYQWRKGASNLANDGRIAGAQSAGLTINNVTAADAGSYSVVVTACGSATTASAEATLTLGGPAAALAFDGADDFVVVNNGANLANRSFTVEAWAKRGEGGGNDIFFSQGTTPDTNKLLHIGFRDNGEFTFAFYNNDLNVGGLSDNNWHLWSCVYRAGVAGADRFIYRDGQLVASDNSPSDYQGQGSFFIGAFSVLGGNFIGTLDEVRVWNRALCQAEILLRARCEPAGNENGLAAYFKFNQGSASANNAGLTAATDSSPNSNHGTLQNFALNGSASNWVAPGGVAIGMACGGLNTSSTTVAANATADFSANNQSVPLRAGVVSGTSVPASEGTVTFQIKSGAILIGAPVVAQVSSGLANVNYTLPGGTAVGAYTIEAAYSPSGGCLQASAGMATLAVLCSSREIFRNDFESGAGAEWSNRTTSTTPAGGRKFLGEFANQQVSLSLNNLPAHAKATVSFDLFILKSTDGSANGCCGAEVIEASVAGGPQLLRATFSNTEDIGNGQSYPGNFPGPVNPARAGAVENNTLGYSTGGRSNWNSSIYKLTYTFDHVAGSLRLDFSAAGMAGIEDESWGLDNVVVSVDTGAPAILTQPSPQTAQVGGAATFSVVATGANLSYQWRKNGTNIAGATAGSLTINPVAGSDAGDYDVVVTGACGSVTAQAARLTVNQPPPGRHVRVVAASGAPGGTVTVPIELVSQGDENALGLSISFDPNVLSNPQPALGGDAGSAIPNFNLTQAANGQVGLALALSSGQTFAAGTRRIFTVTFTIAAGTSVASISINFGDQPIAREVVSVAAAALPASYLAGSVTITRGFEADVAPRPDGNGSVTISDWVQVGRFAAGLDAAAGGSEFQRADVAPREACGNGAISISDWVQAGRFAAGLDPLVPACGPTAPGIGLLPEEEEPAAGLVQQRRSIRALTAAGSPNVVMLAINSLGDENALGLSLLFNPAHWRFVAASRGSDALDALLNINAAQAARGRLGVALALPANRAFATGARQFAVLTFEPVAGAPSSALVVGFTDAPVSREVVAADAQTLAAGYAVELGGSSFGLLTSVSAAGFRDGDLAREQILAAFGANLAAQIAVAQTLPLPTELAGTRVVVTDSQGAARNAPLFFVSPTQINYLLPPGTADGAAMITVARNGGTASVGIAFAGPVAPGLFTADAGGTDLPAATVLRVNAAGASSHEPISRFDPVSGRQAVVPINLGPDLGATGDQVFLVLFGTGVRGRSGPAAVTCTIGGVVAEVSYAGEATGFVGLDQINIKLPRSLDGRGAVDVRLRVDGKPANVVRISVQ